MNETAVAYAVSPGDGSRNSAEKNSKKILPFESSLHCRTALKAEPSTTAVVVCGGRGEVSPINLAAALCADEPDRDVYLMEDQPDESLANRTRVAGIRGIINSTQAQQLLNQPIPPLRTLPSLNAQTKTIRTSLSAGAPRVESGSQGSVIGFFSGRGGVGKSTIALLSALAAQKRGSRVALVDLDIQFGDIGFLAGNEPLSRFQRLSLSQICQEQSPVPLSDEALTLILAPDHPEQGEQYAPEIHALLDDLAAQRDLVFVNTGAFWSDVHAQTVQRCDHLVFLMDQRATSIEACKQVIDLCLRLQTPQVRFAFALNGCGHHAPLTPQDVSLALGGVEVMGLADGGSLVDELLALGCPLELLRSGNALADSIEFLLNRLTGNASSSKESQSQRKEGARRGAILDFAALKDFFKGVNRVAS
jgi:pilus assembly protein CpaE